MFKRLFKGKDELIGAWKTSNEGGLWQVGGSTLEFREDGTGKLNGWGIGDDEPFEFSKEIEWKRMDKKTIHIKILEDHDFELVSYIIESSMGAYHEKFDKLYDPNYQLADTDLKGFWKVPEALFRKKKQ